MTKGEWAKRLRPTTDTDWLRVVTADLQVVEVPAEDPGRLSRRLISLAPVVVGGAILAGGPDRFHPPEFAVAQQIAPHWVWGAAFVLSGLVMCYRAWSTRYARLFWCSFLCACIMGVWAVGIGLSLFVDRHAQAADFAVYSLLAIMLAAVAATDAHPTWRDRRRAKKGHHA